MRGKALKRKEIDALYHQRQNIVDWIVEEMSQYDLTEYDWEYGFNRAIPYEEYPDELKAFLSMARKEVAEVDKKIAALKREYSQPIGGSDNWTDDDWEELYNR